MKSIEFVRQIIMSGRTSYTEDDLGGLREETFPNGVKILEEKYPGISSWFDGDGLKIQQYYKDEFGADAEKDRTITIKYDPDAKFDYFTSDACLCDGTLYFLLDLYLNIIDRILSGGTYFLGDKDFHDNQLEYDVEYTVGNFVQSCRYGDFGTEEKPWLSSKFVVCLPIAFRSIKH